MVYWFIGQPGSGKTTMAQMLSKHLIYLGAKPIFLDGDDLRKMSSGGYGPETFTKEYRIEQTRFLQKLVKHLHDQGFVVIVSTVNPYKDVREEFKTLMAYDITEVYVYTRGFRIRQEKWVENFEEPTGNCVMLDTTGLQPFESFEKLWDSL